MNGAMLARDAALLKQVLMESHPSIIKERNDFNPNFKLLTQAEFDGLFESFEHNARASGELTRFEAIRLVLPLITALNDEHTELPFMSLDGFTKDNRLPIRFSVKAGALKVKESSHSSLEAEDEIEEINGIPSRELISAMSLWFSAVSTEMRFSMLEHFFEEALLLYFGRPTMLEVRCKKTFALRFEGDKQTTPAEFTVDKDVARLKLRSFSGDMNEFKSVISDMFDEIGKHKPEKLVVDLSDNKGGTTSYGDYILSRISKVPFKQLEKVSVRTSGLARKGFGSYLPKWLVSSNLHRWMPVYGKLFRGQDGSFVDVPFKPIRPVGDFASLDVEVIVNKSSMSSSALFAATVQHYGIGYIKGESGGFPSHFGSQFEYVLPETGIRMLIPVSRNTGHGLSCVSGVQNGSA